MKNKKGILSIHEQILKINKLHYMQRRILVAELAGWEKGPKEDTAITRGAFLVKGNHWHKKLDGPEAGWQDCPPAFDANIEAINDVLENVYKNNSYKKRFAFQAHYLEILTTLPQEIPFLQVGDELRD